MPSLESDIVGRVRRLPLRPSAHNSLLPLMEAISNSIDSITERMDDRAVKDGKIVVRVIRDETSEGSPVVGLDVVDNGIGFTEANYRSFKTPDSRKKEATGGKGIGRLAWLKVFKSITVDSTYSDGSDLYRRHFVFQLTDENQLEDVVSDTNQLLEPLTKISFREFDGLFSSRCPNKSGAIARRILSHFVPLFVAGNAPKIVVEDREFSDIESEFSESIVEQKTDKFKLEIDGTDEEFELWSLRCKKSVKFDMSGNNFAFLAANSRAVVDYCLDEQLGLKSLGGEFVYIGCLWGSYLDRHVNAERTGFTSDGGDIDLIKREISKRARDFLANYIEEALTEKVNITKQVIQENPQFLFLQPDVKEFARKLQPNVSKREDIFVELSRSRFREHRKFSAIEKEIVKATDVDDSLAQKIEDYKAHVSQDTKGVLAEYVMRRKAVLDLFEKFLEYKEDEEEQKYHREDVLHSLICPMKVDSNTISIDDHNLWLLDDRLAFFDYFASDQEIKKYAGVDSEERPDLAFFYDSCVAWRDTENSDAVIIVEFKRPMREDYSKGRDPIQQVLHYVKKLQSETAVPDLRGRAIRGINSGTAFHCYIIADITPQLADKIIGRLSRTPDGQGYFGYQTDPYSYVEIVPYSKLLNNARLRNTIFFKKLGITDATE